MHIFVDADALPNVIKDILFRAVERLGISCTLVANQVVTVDKSNYITSISVPAGPDVADDRIVEMVQQGDLVITADIPLADRIVSKGAYGLDPRGVFYSEENIKDRLAMRDLMNDLRNGGAILNGPPAFSRKDRQAFADRLNRFLTQRFKG
jgi:uncharacterized protein YaiI (UPF0178 family)